MYWTVLGSIGLYWAVLGCIGLYWALLGCTGMYWAALGCTGIYWSTGLDWALIGWGGHWSGGSGGPVIQVVQVVRMISIDDMHSENIRFSWSKSSNYQEKLKCHACDIWMDGRTPEIETETLGIKSKILPSVKELYSITLFLLSKIK